MQVKPTSLRSMNLCVLFTGLRVSYSQKKFRHVFHPCLTPALIEPLSPFPFPPLLSMLKIPEITPKETRK